MRAQVSGCVRAVSPDSWRKINTLSKLANTKRVVAVMGEMHLKRFLGKSSLVIPSLMVSFEVKVK